MYIIDVDHVCNPLYNLLYIDTTLELYFDRGIFNNDNNVY